MSSAVDVHRCLILKEYVHVVLSSNKIQVMLDDDENTYIIKIERYEFNFFSFLYYNIPRCAWSLRAVEEKAFTVTTHATASIICVTTQLTNSNVFWRLVISFIYYWFWKSLPVCWFYRICNITEWCTEYLLSSVHRRSMWSLTRRRLSTKRISFTVLSWSSKMSTRARRTRPVGKTSLQAMQGCVCKSKFSSISTRAFHWIIAREILNIDFINVSKTLFGFNGAPIWFMVHLFENMYLFFQLVRIFYNWIAVINSIHEPRAHIIISIWYVHFMNWWQKVLC